MGFKIVFTKPTIQDLGNLVVFISRDNPREGEKFGYEIADKAQNLSEYPLFGRVVPEFKTESLREIIHRPYRILYRVRKEQKLIEILRVWHAARGIPRL